MSKSIVITLPHNLGAETAQKRVAEKLQSMQRDYVDKIGHSEVSWTGNKANIRVVALAQVATAQLDVESDLLRIEVQLPWLLATLAGKIQGVLTSNARDSLRIGTKPEKS